MRTVTLIFLIYYIIINIIGLIIMGVDKRKAIRNAYRIPEANLFCVALLGGALGTTLGMRIFRHKTKHPKFNICIPMFIIIHVAIIAYLILFFQAHIIHGFPMTWDLITGITFFLHQVLIIRISISH